ncbi:MAG TPA: protein-glutamate O-methyltransferase CheR [Burkholderiales bacterium]|nr:protein-glutamate O-methyltransferase CheR [Burkholderiales bacterium]
MLGSEVEEEGCTAVDVLQSATGQRDPSDPEEHLPVVDDIIALVRDRTGVDFSVYRRTTVQRRIGNRMISVGAASFDTYLALLKADPLEAPRLLERLTIKVSRFYRNARSFDYLAQAVLPALIRARSGKPLTLWSAGCGCGEEAYTLAMLLDQAGVEGEVRATDIDPPSLAIAREGIYRREALDELPPILRETYLSEQGDQFEVRQALRRRVHFSFHDLTGTVPPPASTPFDLVSCRNVLIYLRQDAQRMVFETLIGAIAPQGYLYIGEAEWPLPDMVARLKPMAHRTQIFHLQPNAEASQ